MYCEYGVYVRRTRAGGLLCGKAVTLKEKLRNEMANTEHWTKSRSITCFGSERNLLTNFSSIRGAASQMIVFFS